MRRANYSEEQKAFICVNSEDFTVKQLSEVLGISINTVNNIGNKFGLSFKRGTWEKAVVIKNAIRAPQAVKEAKVRPPAIYNQIASPYGVASQMREL